MKKRRMFYLRGLAWAALCIALALAVAFVALPDRAYSPSENRSLQQAPALTLQGAVSGRFEERFERYVSDQFPLRDVWIAVKSGFDRLLGRTKSGGVFLGKDGYLIQDFEVPDEADYARTLDALRGFVSRHGDLRHYALIAPTAVTVLADKLPAFADAGDEGGYLDRLAADITAAGATFVDARQALSRAAAAGTQVYYRTDHHWTSDGAYAAFRAFCEAAGLNAPADYDRRLLSNSFKGTLSAASGFRVGEVDDLYAYIPNGDGLSYVVTDAATGERGASLFRAAQLDTRDQYAVFLGGNAAQLTIETTVDNGRTLLLLKDSYANCLVPMLMPLYHRIVVVDPRYFTGDLDVVIGAEGVTEVLYLYNAQTFAADASLRLDLAGR